MDFPFVAILIITYNRYEALKQVIAALQENISYPSDRIKWIVSDDSTPDGRYLGNLKRIKSHEGIEFITTPQRSGWGKNVNFGLNHIGVHTDAKYVFQIEDDYVLKHPLDLKAGVALLETHSHIGMLRYRGTSGDRLVLHQFTGDIRALYPDYMESECAGNGWICYQLLDVGSPTTYLYSNGPHLKRIRHGGFHEFYGLYPEGRKLGETEIAFCNRVKDKMSIPNAPCIAQIPDFTVMRFDHIGDTWKDSEHDI